MSTTRKSKCKFTTVVGILSLELNNNMVIWVDVPVPVARQLRRKIRGRAHKMVCWGDVPVARINEQTRQLEDVVNPRGKAYAARTRLSYRKRSRDEED